jgi:transcriptional regulator GlxA family with amidase domain
LVIPGGEGSKMSREADVIEWVRRLAPESEITFSVCTGALLLGAAGLLEGLPATTHWEAIVELRTRFPHIDVREHERFVDNGHIVTTQGVSAGIDGALHLVERLLGAAKARSVARYMAYPWKDSASARVGISDTARPV